MSGKQQLALTFAFYEGDQLARRETVVQNIIKVGKDPKSHLRVDDEQANRMHAVIEVQDDVTLIDLGNEAGTMVNGARVIKCKLNEGDQVQIGATLIVLEKIDDGTAVASAVPAGGDEAAAAAAATIALADAPAVSAPAAAAVAAPAVPAASSNPFAAGASNPFASPFGGSNPFAAASSRSSSAAACKVHQQQTAMQLPLCSVAPCPNAAPI